MAQISPSIDKRHGRGAGERRGKNAAYQKSWFDRCRTTTAALSFKAAQAWHRKAFSPQMEETAMLADKAGHKDFGGGL